MEGHMLKESIFSGSFLEYLAKDRIVANQSEMKTNLKDVKYFKSESFHSTL